MIDPREEAARLMALEWQELFDVELERWLAPPLRAHLADLVTALLALPHSPNKQIANDLVSYLDDRELATVAAAAQHVIEQSNASRDPNARQFDGTVRDAADIVAYFALANSPSRFASNLRREIAAQAPQLELDIEPDAFPWIPPQRVPIAEAHHLAFEPCNRRSSDAGRAFGRRNHPTWNLDPSTARARGAFGAHSTDEAPLPGYLRVMRLRDLTSIAPALGVNELDVIMPLELFAGHGSGYVEYDADGAALRSSEPDGEEPWREPVVSAGDFLVVPSPARFARREWGASNGRENLNRLFGAASFIQSDETPDCPTCGETMRFLLQLESGIPCDDGSELFDEGMAYAFFCPPCRIAGWTFQMS